MKKFILQFIFIFLIIFLALFVYLKNPDISNLPFVPDQPIFKDIDIKGSKLRVEIADTQEKRSRGLGGREQLASGEGMLFIFPKPEKHPFWMKGLSFPLDFVWIRENKVVDILYNVQPPTSEQTEETLPVYESIEEVDKVLEVPAGTILWLDIKVGDEIKLIP